ncbi:SpoIIE family protein phosphatase [Maridesulfovibrio bastinii]|uniref:SpoIIE family protein phosphatase n=1 Tax=Maridesulfovibrio bastinii TaxID=47157 RepID=UPI0004216A2B|nr:SpoIIE family protein phosphatase [Maridesulfovibrio bastinii]
MSIRKKIFLLLLGFSLIPMLLVSIISRQGILELGESQSASLHNNMISILTGELRQSAGDSAKLVQQQAISLEFALRAISAEARDVLNDPVNGLPEVYWAEDYDSADKAPKDYRNIQEYFKINSDGTTSPAPVSLENSVFYHAPGKRFLRSDQDIARLSKLTPDFKNFFNEAGTTLFRIFITTKNGLHMAYPGHGDYPENFDPTKRKWFTDAVSKKSIQWGQYIDAGTGQVVFTISMPVIGRNDKVLGVAAVEIQLVQLLRHNELSSQWSSRMKAFVVGESAKKSEGLLRIWAEMSSGDKLKSWREQLSSTRRYLTSSNSEALSRLTENIRSGKSGVIRMPYKGVDCLWAFAPFRSNGSFVLILPEKVMTVVVDNATNRILDLSHNLYLTVGVIAFSIIIIVMTFVLLGSRRLTSHIIALTECARKVAGGDFSVRADVKTGDEREELAEAFNSMVPKLQDQLRLSRSLELAQEVHESLLPVKAPTIEGLDIAGISISCDETGGDYFDYYQPPAPENSVGIVLGDVTGHGASAALLMATGRAHLIHAGRHHSPLAERIAEVNRLLCHDIGDTGRFMTLFCLEIAEGNKSATFVRAGHDPATLYCPATDSFHELKGESALALGIFEDGDYSECSIDICEGGIIVIGTDGIWEARNSSNELFGTDRFLETIRENAQLSAQEIQEAIISAVTRFKKDVPQEDDITLVVIKIEHTESRA